MLMLEVKAGIALLKMLSQTHVWKVRVQGERRRGEGGEGWGGGEEGEEKERKGRTRITEIQEMVRKAERGSEGPYPFTIPPHLSYSLFFGSK
jgi:hypothetical protein